MTSDFFLVYSKLTKIQAECASASLPERCKESTHTGDKFKHRSHRTKIANEVPKLHLPPNFVKMPRITHDWGIIKDQRRTLKHVAEELQALASKMPKKNPGSLPSSTMAAKNLTREASNRHPEPAQPAQAKPLVPDPKISEKTDQLKPMNSKSLADLQVLPIDSPQDSVSDLISHSEDFHSESSKILLYF